MAVYRRIPGRRRAKKHTVIFYKTQKGNYPAREFLQKQSNETKKSIGTDLLKIEWEGVDHAYLKRELNIKSIGNGLWQFSTVIAKGQNRTYRTMFILADENRLVVLHIFQKKAKKGIATPAKEIELAKSRAREYRKYQNQYP